jgi:hypothetical protein
VASRRISFPTQIVQKQEWANLCAYGNKHEICAEDFKLKDSQYSFADGHRVRLYVVKNNVHWKIPEGIPLDISNVSPAQAMPPRKLPNTQR